MWSVWSESLDLYIGPSMALVGVGKADAVAIKHPGGIPADQWLVRLFDDVAVAGLLRASRSFKLRISLSGAYCPAVAYSAPAQVTRWDELFEIARASAAVTVGASADQIVCEMDLSGRGLAGAVATSLTRQLQEWAKLNRCTIVSMQPLWAVAAQSRSVCQSLVTGLLVQDPDATTVLVEQGDGRLVAVTVVGSAAEPECQARVRRLLVSLGSGAGDMLKLGFDISERTASARGPRRWASHWYDL